MHLPWVKSPHCAQFVALSALAALLLGVGPSQLCLRFLQFQDRIIHVRAAHDCAALEGTPRAPIADLHDDASATPALRSFRAPVSSQIVKQQVGHSAWTHALFPVPQSRKLVFYLSA